MQQTAKSPPITPRVYARFLSRYLRPRLGLVLALAVVMFISIGLSVYNPQILRSFIDQATAGAPMAQLNQLGFLFIAIAIASQLINLLVVWITENLGWATTNDLRYDLARYTLGLDMSFHTAHTPGEMIERIDGDVMALSNFFSQFIIMVFGNVLLVGGILLVLWREDWRIGLSLSLFVALTVIVLLRLANISVSSWEEERKASADLYGFLEERLSGTEDIRSNNAKNYVLDRFYRLTRALMRRTITAGLKLNILLNTTWTLFAVGTAVSYLVSAALFRQNAITIGTVYMVVFYTYRLYWPLERITQQMQDLQRAGASLIRIIGIQQIAGRIPGEGDFSRPAANVLDDGALGVAFENVTFSYDDEGIYRETLRSADQITGDSAAAAFAQAGMLAVIESARHLPPVSLPPREIVLREINFRLEPGRVIGLLGRTGSGKTTLTRLLFRLYDPDDGAILLGNEGGEMKNIRSIPVQELRRRIGMVTQNIQLFHATVRENLTFFDPSVPDARIHEAIHDLGLERWFQSLPQGLDTELESGGGGLSAGEAQLLAFTRIFLRDPGIVILDEATSRLDPATEALIEQAVTKLVRGRTAIIVAHRLGTVQRADDILILENGQVIEYGPRARLAEDPSSRFAHLLRVGMEEVLV